MLTVPSTRDIISRNMTSVEASKPESLAAIFAREYSYGKAWDVKPTTHTLRNGKECVIDGTLSPKARQSAKGSGGVYIVDTLDKVLAGRQLPQSPEDLINGSICDGIPTPFDKSPRVTCGAEATNLILSNGRWQESTNLSTKCDSHSKDWMDDEVAFYYREDWDFMNAPVFGVYRHVSYPIAEAAGNSSVA